MNDMSRSPVIDVTLRNVEKVYGDFKALKGVSLDVEKGETIVICGPSGSGKSTLIRCINRLEAHDGGEITVRGITVDASLDRGWRTRQFGRGGGCRLVCRLC